AELKAVAGDVKRSEEERAQARLALQKLPRNSIKGMGLFCMDVIPVLSRLIFWFAGCLKAELHKYSLLS
ncbi:MAG: hypothetical protein ACFNZS_12800, partial [Ottowia sp.]